MTLQRFPRWLLFCLLIAGGILFQYPDKVAAQSTAQPAGETGTSRTNQAALKKLKTLSPEEIHELDAFMAQALTLYYDRKFAQALPIFKQVADKVETMDIMFWLGTSAAKAGETELAVAEFNKMLAIDPNLHRVRLELASVYFATGRHTDARRELETVQRANPPPQVLENIKRMLAAIKERTRTLSWNLRLATGFMWDDNISTGPDPGVYSLPGGSSFRPSLTSAKLSDQASVTSFAGNLLFDVGEKQGFMWNTGTSFYFKGYMDYSEFDYLAVDINTGPWWAGRRSIFKMPVGYSHSEYGSDRLSFLLHVDPSYEYFFNPHVSLRGTYIFKREWFYQKARADNFDNDSHIIELAPTVYLGNRRHIITATLSHDHHSAQNAVYTYDAPIVGLSYFTRFPTKTELYLGYQWTRRDYAYPQTFPYAGLKREDERHYYTAVLSQVFFKYFNVSYAFGYTINHSNLDLNEWDKTTHTISMGCQF